MVIMHEKVWHPHTWRHDGPWTFLVVIDRKCFKDLDPYRSCCVVSLDGALDEPFLPDGMLMEFF